MLDPVFALGTNEPFRSDAPPVLDPRPHAAAPPIVCVTGARRGVGVSTTARLVAAGMQRRLEMHACGRRVAMLELEPRLAGLGSPWISSYLSSAQRIAPAVVLDMVAGSGPMAREVVRHASHLVLVSDLAAESLAATVVAAQTLGIVHPGVPVWIVMNRATQRAGRIAFAAVESSVAELAAAVRTSGLGHPADPVLRYAGALSDDSAIARSSSWPPPPWRKRDDAQPDVVSRLAECLLETPS